MCVPALADRTCFARFDLSVCMRDAPPGGKEIDHVLTDGQQASCFGELLDAGIRVADQSDGRWKMGDARLRPESMMVNGISSYEGGVVDNRESGG